jgi:hypothetical protein
MTSIPRPNLKSLSLLLLTIVIKSELSTHKNKNKVDVSFQLTGDLR